jgi:hypothetical protein
MVGCAGTIATNKWLKDMFGEKRAIELSAAHLLYGKDEKNCDPEFRFAIFVSDVLVGGTGHQEKKAWDSMELSYDEADEEAQAYFDWIYIHTKKLLETPKWWLAVSALAFKLIEVRTLKFKEANAIIEAAIRRCEQFPESK